MDLKNFYKQYIKRVMDILCSFLFLVLFWWLLVLVAFLVKIRLGSPILFTQDRPGKKGKVFKLYKFRSMIDKCDKEGNPLPDDERLPKFGRILRSTSLDELPEIFNILKGDMSVVGPRPLLVEYLPYKVNIIENPKQTFSLEHDILKDIDISTINLDHSTECIGYSLYFKRKPKFDREKAILNQVPQNLWKKLQENSSAIYKDKTYYADMVLGENRRGIKLSFITDTRPTFEIPEFIYESDLFICEGMYGDDLDISKAVKNKHMTFRESASLANAGNVDKLLLTHFSPSIENPKDFIQNATNLFEDTIIGEDGLTLKLSYTD